MTTTTIAAAFQKLYAAGFTTLTEVIILLEVARLEDIGETAQLTNIARNLDMPPSTVSRVLWDLTERKWLTRSEHPQDRRAVLVGTNRKALNKVLGVTQ